MIYDDNTNPFDFNLLSEISEYFQTIRHKYKEYEGSLRGADINMLINQVPGGMLSILEKQLLDLKKQSKLKDLIKEIPKIREDVGYVPLVTPSSQIVGAQALMNVLDGKRYNTLNKEFVDLVLGKYGKIPGKVSSKLLKKVEKFEQDEDVSYVSVKENRSKFSAFCKDNGLNDISKQDTHLLNFILFNKESKEFYQSKNKNTMNDIIGLQEGFGLYIE
jgi:oxaloacetate decarboxylase alpha subunit